MDKQTTCQLVQGISKLGGCAHPKVSKVCKSYLLNASGRSKICQKTPLSPPGALCCSETAYHILTKKKKLPQPKPSKNNQKITSTSPTSPTFFFAFSGRQAEASADLRWARRTASAGNWLEIVPPLRSWKEFFSHFASRLHKWKLQFLEWFFFSYRWQIFSAFTHEAKKMKDTLR